MILGRIGPLETVNRWTRGDLQLNTELFLNRSFLSPTNQSQAEARAEFAERSVQKLQKEVDRLEGMYLLNANAMIHRERISYETDSSIRYFQAIKARKRPCV